MIDDVSLTASETYSVLHGRGLGNLGDIFKLDEQLPALLNFGSLLLGPNRNILLIHKFSLGSNTQSSPNI